MDLIEIKGKVNTAICKWQQGAAMPTIDNLVVLAMVFDVPMDEIIIVDVDTRAKASA